jgi:hypothetical protein
MIIVANRAGSYTITDAQERALRDLCDRYNVEFDPMAFRPQFDLPTGYVAGWVGPIFVGCSSDGRISS